MKLYAQPGDDEYWEDDPEYSKILGDTTNSALDLGRIDWTGIIAMPGATTVLDGEVARNITWTLKCETEGSPVGSIMGSASFTPYIRSDGIFHTYSVVAGLLPPGSVGNVIAAFAAAYNPYAGASVLFTTWALGSKPHTNYGLIGECIIENGSGTPDRINQSGSVTNLWSTSIDLSALNTSVGQSTSEPDFTVRGSFHIKAKLQCFDNSISSEITGTLKTSPSSPVGFGSSKWGSSRPSYGRGPYY